MQINIVNKPHFDPILGPTQKVIQTTNTLRRISELNNSLSFSNIMRSKGIKAIQEIAASAQELLPYENLEDVKMTLKTGLENITTGVIKGKNIAKIYTGQIEAATTVNELSKCIRHILKDSSSLLTFSIQKSNKGQNGPTYLVSYTRPSKKSSKPNLREYVIKWTNENEICSWRLYDVFSQNLALQSFILPKMAVLGLDKQLHEMCDQTCFRLEEETAINLKQSLIGIVNKNTNPNDTLMIFMERVSGSNLFDFAKDKYQLLNPEEKQDLFEKMGRLSMLDMLIGNTDRLIQTSYNKSTKQYQCENQTANLGNIMVDWFPNEGKVPSLYAIDNGIKPQLITDEEEKAAYKQFVGNYFEDSKMTDVLADLIVDSMQKGCRDNAELSTTLDITLAHNLKEYQPFLDDLKDSDLLKQALVKGLFEMSMTLKEQLPSFWNSDEALKIKNYLKENYPMLQDAVTERIQILNRRDNMNSLQNTGPKIALSTDEAQTNPYTLQSQETSLTSWLVAIESHGRTGSAESQRTLIKLAKTLPDHDSLPQDVQEGIIEITEMLKTKNWEPDLSPQSKKVLQKICKDHSPESKRTNQEMKPSCAKRLFG